MLSKYGSNLPQNKIELLNSSNFVTSEMITGVSSIEEIQGLVIRNVIKNVIDVTCTKELLVDGDKVLLFTGRLTREKGIKEILLSLKKVKSENYKLLSQKKCFAEIDALIEKSKENEKTKEEVFGKKRRSCSVCGITKDIDEFNWNKKYKSLRSQCKKCQSEYKKKWELKRIEERGY